MSSRNDIAKDQFKDKDNDLSNIITYEDLIKIKQTRYKRKHHYKKREFMQKYS